MGFYFDSTCPACQKGIRLHGDDSDGPTGEIGAQCENCGACVSQQVECRYEYDLVGAPEVTSERGGTYCFLYTSYDPEAGGRDFERFYKAANIGKACDKMMRFIERKGWGTDECTVDYEVLHDGGAIDIYALSQHPLYKYLP
jgi:hypothetical protein